MKYTTNFFAIINIHFSLNQNDPMQIHVCYCAIVDKRVKAFKRFLIAAI